MTQEGREDEEQPAADAGAGGGDETAKTAGRGFLIITAAKVWFLVTSACVQLGLPIIFGSAEQFGVFKIVTELVGLINMVVVTGSLQAVSKLVSEQPGRASQVVTQALKMQLAIGVPLAAFYAIASPWMAGGFHDPSLTSLIRLSSLIILFYAFYAIFVGYLNGLKEFVKQAGLDMGFSTMKAIGILGLVALGFGVSGAVAGFVSAAGLICLFAGVLTFRLMSRTEEADSDEAGAGAADAAAWRRLLGFLILIMLYTFALNGLMRVDLFALKSVAANVPPELAQMAGSFKLISDKLAGFYGAALNISRIPYQGVIAVTFVVFPLISEATFRQDRAATQTYIRETIRYCLLLIGAVAILLSFNSDTILGVLYSADYGAASQALSVLSVAIIFFALFYVMTTIIISAGHPLVAVVLMGLSTGLSAILNAAFLTLTHQETQQALLEAGTAAALEEVFLARAPDYLNAAAMATAIAMGCGFLGAALWLWRRYGAALPLPTLARLLAATVVLYGVDLLWQLDPALAVSEGKFYLLLVLLAKMAVMGVALLGFLLLSREFNERDWDRVRAVLGR